MSVYLIHGGPWGRGQWEQLMGSMGTSWVIQLESHKVATFTKLLGIFFYQDVELAFSAIRLNS